MVWDQILVYTLFVLAALYVFRYLKRELTEGLENEKCARCPVWQNSTGANGIFIQKRLIKKVSNQRKTRFSSI